MSKEITLKELKITCVFFEFSLMSILQLDFLRNYFETHSSLEVTDSQPEETKVSLDLPAIWRKALNYGGTLGK